MVMLEQKSRVRGIYGVGH